jgi:hypothetical protein
MNELYFLGMDIVEETKTLANLTTITCTDGMTESELAAYKLGIENALSAMKAVLQDNEVPVINVDGMEIPTELSIDDLEQYHSILC